MVILSETMHINIRHLQSIAELDELAKDAEADGQRMVARLIQEWTDGTNRFDQPGEILCCGWIDGGVVGVCGLNRDPFANDGAVGRVRRLYVTSSFRRRRLGSAILDQVVADARVTFRVLHLRTHDPVAAAFYNSYGFSDVRDDLDCTHSLSLSVPAGTSALQR
jgi:GNAT superfamily N-acetyltransferase